MFQIFRPFFTKKTDKIQVGFAENAQHRCLVWQTTEEIQAIWQAKEDDPLLALQRIDFLQNFVIIYPVASQYIWRKQVSLPSISKTMLYKQVIHILRQELPLALEEVYFDYRATTQLEQNICHLSLYAIRKEYADTLHFPFPTILDCESHCRWRGLCYLNAAYAEADMTLGQDIDLSDDTLHFPEHTTDKSLYLSALGASLWNGKA